MRKEMTIVTIILFVIMLLIGGLFIYIFCQQSISQNLVDWGYFGSFCDGIFGTLLTVLNIYIFYRLTEIAANFGKQSSWTQICHGVLQEYQNNINKLTLDFLSNMELYKESVENGKNNKNKHLERAKNRLYWILYMADCFCDEAKSVLSNEEVAENKFNDAKKELENSVKSLVERNLCGEDELSNFLDAKSNFINIIIKELKNEDEE